MLLNCLLLNWINAAMNNKKTGGVFVCGILSIFFAELGFTQPRFVIAGDGWDEKTVIFLANARCPIKLKQWQEIKFKSEVKQDTEIQDMIFVGAPKRKYPKEAFQGFRVFLEKNQKRNPVIYALATQGRQRNAYLYQLDAKTGEELFAYALPDPIKSGTLMVEDVYFANHWHSVLVIAAQDFADSSFQVLLLDITDPKQIKNQHFLLPPTYFKNPSLTALRVLSVPKIIRTLEGQWGILIGGKIGEEAAITIIPFDQPNPGLRFKAGKGIGFSTLIPIDFDTRGYTDKIYAVDDGGDLWLLDFVNVNSKDNSDVNSRFKKLNQTSKFSTLQKLYVVKSPRIPGIEILAIERKKESMDTLVHLWDKDNNRKTSEELKKQTLASGQYQDCFLWGGQAILIPKVSNQKPEVFLDTGKGFQKINLDWQAVLPVPNSVAHRVQAACIWDFSEKKMKILSLTEDGQFNILETQPILGGLNNARVAFRKISSQD